MRNPLITVIIVLILLIIGVTVWRAVKGGVPSLTSTSTPASLDQSISDGIFTVSFPSTEFGLATNQSQVLVQSNIPPCNQNFNYCLYYATSTYQGTNFDSAGIRIQKRTDLGNERLCLQTPPAGFNASVTPTASTSVTAYSASRFSNIGTAAAGHTASDTLYRIFYRQNSSCYEFQTRIAQSQFANYATGTIREFTSTNQANLQQEITRILDNLKITGEKVILP